ncbi:hypothetical protein [Dyadobacter psychrotolerans]|uniref:Uncharacterized protein n=1 Tax=Dyadobacter psychrotolerans TaxID=2541721 RepID=A0A4R5DVB6_9BACT|nr:hypothetical protein [Dyadobacter psychrotolerans]TDE18486.1 hypothetical protein E0F88_02820 [Dyadobacter psychrotolerans]
MKDSLSHFIEQIEISQSAGDRYFPAGIFPAYRVNNSIAYNRPDTTIFFSAIIAFTLQSIRPKTSAVIHKKIDLICEKVIGNYPDFQNKDGLKTYNFWKTIPSRHFPNGNLFRHFEHFRIPDDIDDTAFVYLTTKPSQEELLWLKEKLKLHANGVRQWIKNTYPEYKSLKAYSTWFGKNMYIEFDVSVLCNMLYCVFKYELPLNENDEASLLYVRSVIETDRYLRVPFRCAHQYPRTALIIYHVARLIAAFDPEILKEIRKKLIYDTVKLLNTATHAMDRVILSTSLLRLGVKPERILTENFTAEDFKGFYFFIAGLLTAYENPVVYKMSNLPIFHMQWICEAHCWTLLAEYEVLWSSADTTLGNV